MATPPPSLWVETRQMADHLGISTKTLLRLRVLGLLKEGQHWAKKNPLSSRGIFVWHLQRCEMRLNRM